MTRRLITVFGGSGFIGRHLVGRLAKQGHRIRAAVRRPNDALFLKPMGDVGQVLPIQANVRNRQSVARALEGADGAVNLVGILYQAGRQRFATVQAEGAGIIAEEAARAGVRQLVHVSAIGADADSAAKYAQSKAVGEELVKQAFPAATILRPSIVFGPEDGFFNRFAGLAKRLPVLPLIGGATRFQPVFVGDVADAIARCLDDGADVAGRTFELGGPRVYSFEELLQLMMDEIAVHRPLLPIPFSLAAVQAFFLQALPNPPLTVDQVRLLKHDNVVSDGAPSLADLGIEPTPVETVIPSYLVRFRPHGQFSTYRRT